MATNEEPVYAQKKSVKLCIRPNRKEIRTFKTCDAVRICREIVVDDNTTPEELLACIAKHLGFTHISLSRPRFVQSGLVPYGAVAKSLEVLIKVIESLQRFVARFPKAISIIEGLVALNDAVTRMKKLLEEEVPEQVRVGEAINPEKCRCKIKPVKLIENMR